MGLCGSFGLGVLSARIMILAAGKLNRRAFCFRKTAAGSLGRGKQGNGKLDGNQVGGC